MDHPFPCASVHADRQVRRIFDDTRPALITMSWLDRVHFAFTNPLIVFGRVPFFYYAAHLVLAHGIAIVLNFVRYGRTPFLWIATPSSGRPSDLFPSN